MSLEVEGCLPDKPPRKKCTSLLRKVEKLRLGGKTGPPSGYSSETRRVKSDDRVERLHCPAR